MTLLVAKKKKKTPIVTHAARFIFDTWNPFWVECIISVVSAVVKQVINSMTVINNATVILGNSGWRPQQFQINCNERSFVHCSHRATIDFS